MHNFIKVSSTMPKFRQIWSNSKKTPGQTTGQTLFHRIPSATAKVLTSITAVDWHLKVKDIDYDIGTIALQSTCKKSAQFIHSFLKIQQILGFHKLNKWLCPVLTTPTQKLEKWLLAFLNLHQHAKNQFIPSILFWWYSQF